VVDVARHRVGEGGQHGARRHLAGAEGQAGQRDRCEEAGQGRDRQDPAVAEEEASEVIERLG
jgi:hypothetical protein